MKTLASIFFIITFFNYPPHKVNDTSQLLTRWVVNATNPDSFLDLEEIEFVLYNSSEAKRLPMHLKYGGITFQKDGVFIEHWWNMCGTGNPPSSKEGKWKISDHSNEKMVIISGSNKWNGEYIIKYIDSESLLLKRIK